jgi:type IV pilus assembly protein PilE
MKSQRGVTLMELLTVIAVIGILAAIAYPAYIEQAAKGRRAAGKSMLHEVLQYSERFYAQNSRFTTSMTDLGFSGSAPFYNDSRTHTITLAAGPSGNIATSVWISATPVNADAKCGVLKLASNMARDAANMTPGICW